MKFRLVKKRAQIVEIIFLTIMISIIFISCFKALPWGPDEIGIRAKKLEIIDRQFYIRDEDPFGKKGYETFKGGPLYPKILEGISFLSIKIFNQSTTSILWNSLTIVLCSTLSFLTLRIIYFSGKILENETTGVISMAIFAACPYSYLYTLSGGITIYVLFGTSLCTYLVLSLVKNNFSEELPKKKFLISIFLSVTLIYLALLRPSSLIYGICLSLILFILLIYNFKNKKYSKLTFFFYTLILIIPIFISIDQLWQTRDYSTKALEAFQLEKGTFLGYSRELLREKIINLKGSESFISNFQANLYQILWKINDFLTGMIDIRDTHNDPGRTANIQLLPFLGRVSVGTFFLAPLTYISLLGSIIFRKNIFKSGLWICLIATFIAISPSLIGVAMSRYYFMFISPVILICSLTLYKLHFSSQIKTNE